VKQILTDSSASRQQRPDEWVKTQSPLTVTAAHVILFDQHDSELPVYRLSASDLDEENTLATAIFTLSRADVTWQMFTSNREQVVFNSQVFNASLRCKNYRNSVARC